MLGLLTTILGGWWVGGWVGGGWVLDFARLKLTQPSKLSFAGAGAELGNYINENRSKEI